MTISLGLFDTLPFNLNPFMSEIHLNNARKFCFYLIENTLRLYYKAQPVNAV
jgi:hypothetical protein